VKLPFGERARLGTKLEDYTLNPLHRDGRHKARVFEVKFGINQGNLEPLRAALTYAAENSDAVVAKGDNGFGEMYLLDFALTNDIGSGTVRSVWIVRHGEDFPRLTTCYVL
jgi:Domain of unknown function (DUF6883)